jgi:hypothetical protein
MAFDAAAYAPGSPKPVLPVPTPVEAADEPCPVWAAANPDRALALLFVSPRACAAVDVLVSL